MDRANPLPGKWVLLGAGAFLLAMMVIFADILVVNLIKIPWGRVRMRLVAAVFSEACRVMSHFVSHT